MKTITQINQKIDQIRATIPGPKTKKQLGQIQKQLGLLIVLKQYLASNPNPELVYRQLDLINQKIIEYKKQRIPLDNMLKDNRKLALQDLNKKFQITKLRKQKKALEYLLGEAELA